MEETKLLCSDASVDANYTNFGCIGCSAYIRKDSGHNNSSTTISDIVHCNVGDHIAVRLTQEAATGLVTAPTGGSNFTAELYYKYPGSAYRGASPVMNRCQLMSLSCDILMLSTQGEGLELV